MDRKKIKKQAKNAYEKAFWILIRFSKVDSTNN